jgi:hypothetical protein
MQLTRDEAQIFLNMIGSNETVPDSSMPILDKINYAFPDLLRGTKYPKLLVEWRANREKVKKSALAQISELLASAKENVTEATRIAKAAGVGFELCIGDPDYGCYFDPNEGWNSSNC